MSYYILKKLDYDDEVLYSITKDDKNTIYLNLDEVNIFLLKFPFLNKDLIVKIFSNLDKFETVIINELKESIYKVITKEKQLILKNFDFNDLDNTDDYQKFKKIIDDQFTNIRLTR